MRLILPVASGLGLFLYGMNMMSLALGEIAGNKLKRLIEVLTTSRIRGILVGALITMIIQSSSATTVMAIGFINAGLMTLTQAVGLIMGANIGTTITSHMIALNLTNYAPIFIAFGVGLWSIYSREKIRVISRVVIGFGVLFLGMDMISLSLSPLANYPIFIDIITSLKNPILGVVAGALLTTILQSSSAAIGLIQALAGEGFLSMNIILPILFGENIGTTTTALLSSIGGNIHAKRAAVVHFLFNLLGTIIFMSILRYPVEVIAKLISPKNIQGQIANVHSLFNIINTLIQLPFIEFLVRATKKLVPENINQKLDSPIY